MARTKCEHDYDYVGKEGTCFHYRCVNCGKDYWQERKCDG